MRKAEAKKIETKDRAIEELLYRSSTLVGFAQFIYYARLEVYLADDVKQGTASIT
jgi:hypothetical protein